MSDNNQEFMFYKNADGSVDSSCQNTLLKTPVVIPSDGVKKCSLLCAVEFTYPSTGWSLQFNSTPRLSHFQFDVNNTSNAPHLKYNGDSYLLRKIEFYATSLHQTMETGTETSYDAEMCLWHQSVNTRKWAVVSVFLNQSGSYSVSQEFFREMLYPLPNDLTNVGKDLQITLSESWSPYQGLPYKKSFYIYSGTSPYAPCVLSAANKDPISEMVWIVFDNKVSIDGNGEYKKLVNICKTFIGNDGGQYPKANIGARPIYYNDGSFVPGNMDSTNKVYVKCMKKPTKNSQLALKQNNILDNTTETDQYNHYGIYATSYSNGDYSDSSPILLIAIFCVAIILIYVSHTPMIYLVTMIIVFVTMFFYTFVGSPQCMSIKYSSVIMMYVFGMILSKLRQFLLKNTFGELSTGYQIWYIVCIFFALMMCFNIVGLGFGLLFANNLDTYGGLSAEVTTPFHSIFSVSKVFYEEKSFTEFEPKSNSDSTDLSLFATDIRIAEKALICVTILSNSVTFGTTNVSLNNYINQANVRERLAHEYNIEMKKGDNTPRGCWSVAVNKTIKDSHLFDEEERKYFETYRESSYDPKKYGLYDFMGVYQQLSL
jgi:carbonic anhydrase